MKALDQVSLSIAAGTTCGIVGESGSGKTTLGMAILKLIKSEGGIFFDGRDLQPLAPGEMRPLRKEIQVVFQDPYSSFLPGLTVAEIIREGLRIHFRNQTRIQRATQIEATLAEVGLEPGWASGIPTNFRAASDSVSPLPAPSLSGPAF